ncbi:GNAT family N-acetyltransferase [Alkaliphilus transvaalensis]|uniref:GNAT family N-acetyltransferase n=1 Tax=Alkaliphilus transvaalensis TaxID=114628 RepID=UPI000686FA33|nr:GNAT family N-acetyltransferase [Alkaliphilus transvaalensis]
MYSIDDKVIIKKTTEENLKEILVLWNNGEVMKWVGFPKGLNMTDSHIWGWYCNISLRDWAYHFVVYHQEVGFCGELYYDIDVKYKRAGLDIKFLPTAQGKGLASKAFISMINHIFENEKNILSVWAEPTNGNFKAKKLFARCGLKETIPAEFAEPKESYWELKREDWLQINYKRKLAKENI